MKKLISSLILTAIFAVNLVSVGVSATEYNVRTFVSSGGSAGKIDTRNCVFRDSYSPPQSGITIFYYGVKGEVIGKQLTNWNGGGVLYTISSSKDITGSANKAANCKVQDIKQGAGGGYITYALKMNTNSSEFGKTSYQVNGSF